MKLTQEEIDYLAAWSREEWEPDCYRRPAHRVKCFSRSGSAALPRSRVPGRKCRPSRRRRSGARTCVRAAPCRESRDPGARPNALRCSAVRRGSRRRNPSDRVVSRVKAPARPAPCRASISKDIGRVEVSWRSSWRRKSEAMINPARAAGNLIHPMLVRFPFGLWLVSLVLGGAVWAFADVTDTPLPSSEVPGSSPAGRLPDATNHPERHPSPSQPTPLIRGWNLPTPEPLAPRDNPKSAPSLPGSGRQDVVPGS